MLEYTQLEFEADIVTLSEQIRKSDRPISAIYGVPRGGVPVAMALAQKLGLPLDGWEEKGQLLCSRRVPHPLELLVVDDLIDSGKTRRRFSHLQLFACLHEKTTEPVADFCPNRSMNPSEWIHYWWEGSEVQSIEDAVIRQLQFIGEDVGREGLKETPGRVVRSWGELYAGYKQDPAKVFKVFEDGACDEMVLLKNVEFYSTCEHHMLPFFGRAHIAYIPNGKVIGVSKLARLLEVYSRRLQIQERLGQQITTAINTHLKPKGAACILEAQHFCMTSRGIQKQNSVMVTSSLTGVFRDGATTRSELLNLVYMGNRV